MVGNHIVAPLHKVYLFLAHASHHHTAAAKADEGRAVCDSGATPGHALDVGSRRRAGAPSFDWAGAVTFSQVIGEDFDIRLK